MKFRFFKVLNCVKLSPSFNYAYFVHKCPLVCFEKYSILKVVSCTPVFVFLNFSRFLRNAHEHTRRYEGEEK